MTFLGEGVRDSYSGFYKKENFPFNIGHTELSFKGATKTYIITEFRRTLTPSVLHRLLSLQTGETFGGTTTGAPVNG